MSAGQPPMHAAAKVVRFCIAKVECRSAKTNFFVSAPNQDKAWILLSFTALHGTKVFFV